MSLGQPEQEGGLPAHEGVGAGWVLRTLPTQPLCDSMKISLKIHVCALFLLLLFLICAYSGTEFPGYAAEQRPQCPPIGRNKAPPPCG